MSAVLAASIHFYVLLSMREQGLGRSIQARHCVFGFLALLPALYVIFPPADSELNMAFWLNRWDFQQLKSAFAIPVRAFMPVSAWWEHHFWNTHCLLQIQDPLRLLRGMAYLLSLLFPVLAVHILKDDCKSRLLFLANLLATFAMGILIPLANARYVGLVFIGFIVAAWLHGEEKELRGRRLATFYALLIIQIAGSAVAIPKDIKHVFSNAFRTRELLRMVPPGEMAATDFFGLTAVAAYAEQPFYCIEKNKPAYFLEWNSEMTNLDANKNRYVKGAEKLFSTTGRRSFYLLTMNSIKGLRQSDTGLFRSLNVTLAAQREGAIEKYSNIYLYRIERRQPENAPPGP